MNSLVSLFLHWASQVVAGMQKLRVWGAGEGVGGGEGEGRVGEGRAGKRVNASLSHPQLHPAH